MASLTCPKGDKKDAKRFIVLTIVRGIKGGVSDEVKARICPDCGSIFVEKEEMKALWPNYFPK
jgi:hypothetical protein